MTRIGLVIADEPASGWSRLGELASAVEDLGADALWFTDHLFWFRSTADPLTSMALAVAATERMSIGSLVLQLPLRRPAAVAKSAAFLQEVSGGRIVLGLGIGEHRSEFEAAGLRDSFGRRGRLLDEGIASIRSAWDGDGVDAMSMVPAHRVPIWVGGRSEAARRRAAMSGDAWAPHLCPIGWYREQVPLLLEDAAAAGREGRCRPAVGLMVHVTDVSPGEDPLAWVADLYRMPPEIFDRVIIRGSAASVAERLAEFVDAGATELALVPTSPHPAEHMAALLPHLAHLRSP